MMLSVKPACSKMMPAHAVLSRREVRMSEVRARAEEQV